FPGLETMLAMIEQLTTEIRRMDREVERLGQERYPETRGLRQVQGVGPITALAFVLTLEDPSRFARSRSVGSYLGLRPRQRDSGEQRPQLRITKAGDALLRRLLVTAAHYILGPSGPTRRFAATGCGSPSAAARPRRSEPSWRSLESSRCCCTGCGSAGRSTSRSATTPRSRRRPEARWEVGNAPSGGLRCRARPFARRGR